MKEWKYLIGSADDFIGAPEWATIKIEGADRVFFVEHAGVGAKFINPDRIGAKVKTTGAPAPEEGEVIIAQRTESFGNAIDLEFCKANPDHPDCKCKEGFLKGAFKQSEGEVIKAISEAMKVTSLDDNYKTYTINIDDRPSKYNRPCKGVTIDVYDVLQAFAVTNPAAQHAVKKLLCAGLRGHKDKMQDLTEALKSVERAIELEK